MIGPYLKLLILKLLNVTPIESHPLYLKKYLYVLLKKIKHTKNILLGIYMDALML